MKKLKKFKKVTVTLLCISLVMTNVMPSFAENSKPVSEEVSNVVENSEEIIQEVDKVTTDEEKAVEDSDDSENVEKELAEQNEENNEEIAEELGEEPEEEPEAEPEENLEEEPEEELEVEPEEKQEADLEEIEDITEEVDVSSPSEVIDEENEDNAATLEELEEDVEEKEVLLDEPASPSDAEENENVINDEEVSSPSELQKPMLLTAPLFGATDPEVWKIGDKGYKSLQDAIYAATDGCTIEPGADYDTNGTIVVPSVSYANFGINIYPHRREQVGINYTIDFKDKPLKVSLGESNRFPFGGVIQQECDCSVKLKGINGVELDFTADWVGDKVISNLIGVGTGEIEIEDCTFEYGDEIESLFCGGNIVIGDGNTINIPGKVAKIRSLEVKENSTSEITVTNGDCFDICGGATKIKGGTFTVENGSFIHSCYDYAAFNKELVELSNANVTINGTSEGNALIDIDDDTYVVINSGTYNLLGNSTFIYTDGTYTDEDGQELSGEKDGEIIVNGGKFKFKKLVAGSEENGIKFDFKGGLYKYTGDPIVINESTTLITTEDVISYYVSLHYYDYDGLYSVKSSSDPDYDVEVAEEETYPWKIGDVKYTSLQKAIDAATDGCVIEPCDADSEDGYDDYDEKGAFIITEDNTFITIDNDVNFTIDFKDKPMKIKATGIFLDDQIAPINVFESKACAIHKKGTNEVKIKNIQGIKYINETTINPVFPVFKVSGRLVVENSIFESNEHSEGISHVVFYKKLTGKIFLVEDEGNLLYATTDNREKEFNGVAINGGKAELRGIVCTCVGNNFLVAGGTLKLNGCVFQSQSIGVNGSLIDMRMTGEKGGGNVEIDGLSLVRYYSGDPMERASLIHYDFAPYTEFDPTVKTTVKIKSISVNDTRYAYQNLVTVRTYEHVATLSTIEIDGGDYIFKDSILKHLKAEYGYPEDSSGGVEVILKGGNYRYAGTDGATTQEKVAPYVAEGYTTKALIPRDETDYNLTVVNDERKWKIGENTYRTLQEAVDEVASGSIIERITTADNEAFFVSPGGVAVYINGKEDFTIDFKNDPLLIYLNYNLEDEFQYRGGYGYGPNIVQLTDSKNVTIKNINKIKLDTTSPNYQELIRWAPDFPEDNPHYGMGMTRNKPLLQALIFTNSGAKLMIENCDLTYEDEGIDYLYFLDQRKGGVAFEVHQGVATRDRGETIIGDNNTIVSGIELARVFGGKFTVKEGSNSTFVSTNKGFIIDGGDVEIGGGKYTLNASAINGFGAYWYQSLAFLDFENSCGAATVSNAEVNVGVNSDIANSLVEFDFRSGTPTPGKAVTFTSGTYNVPGKLVYNKAPEEAASNTVKITGGKYTFGNGDEKDESVKLILEGGSFRDNEGGTENKISSYVPTGYMIQDPSLESGYDVDVVKAEYVCKVGTNKYYTLQEAIDAVTENGTIDIIKNVFDNTQISIKDKKFTINFNDGTTQYSFKNPKGTDKEYIFLIENSEVTVNDFKYIIGQNVERNTIFKVKSDGKLTLNNTICDSADNIADTFVYNDGGEVVVDGGNITSKATQGIFVNASSGKFVIKGDGVFNIVSQNRFLGVDSENSKFDFQSGNVKYYPDYFCKKYKDTQKVKGVVIASGKFGKSSGYTDIKDEINGLKAENTEVVEISEDGYIYEIKASGPACKIGTTEYLTLNEALDAATSGDTITMIRNITYENTPPDLIIDGKTVSIDFAGFSMTVQVPSMIMSPASTKIFTLTNSASLTIDSASFVLNGTYGASVSPFTVASSSTLNLINVTQANNLGHFLTLDGGSATINGGTFGTNGDNIIMNLTNNATLKLTNNPTLKFQGNIINIGATSNTDADTLAANVTIDNGIFNSSSTAGIVALYAKANVTINDATFTSSNSYSAPIFVGNGGYKSNVVINNITCESPYIFRSSNNANIESFVATVNNGHFKYTKGQFAIDSSSESKPAIKLNGGYFGPNTADDDALAELTAICPAGKKVEVLATEDPEYVKGYKYKVVDDGGSSSGGEGSTGGGFSSGRSSGGSSGGGGGGGGGSTGGTTNGALATSTRHDPSSDPDLTGPITVTTWNSDATGTQASDIRYAQNTDSFVHSDNTPVVSDWVGVNTSTTTKVAWYRTDATGKIYKNSFVRIGDIVYYFDANGVMVTGDFEIDGVLYHFDTTPGATEGKLLI